MPDLPEHISWAGQTLSGKDQLGEWFATDFKGWWDSPDPKGGSVPMEGADGDHDLPIYNDARYVLVAGNFHAKSHNGLHDAGDALTGIMRGRFQVDGHGPSRWAEMARNAKTVWTPVTDVLAQFHVELKAPDPRKFGDVRSFPAGSGGVGVFHRGNYDASPVVSVPGPVAGMYTVNGPDGEKFTVAGGIPSGTVHTIDMVDGLLRVNMSISAGVGKVTRADTFTVPPGGKPTVSINGATGTIYVTDTYI